MVEVKVREEERDPEAIVMDVAMHYMNHADERGRQRFMMHMQHRYFPDGVFMPVLKDRTTLTPRAVPDQGPIPV